MERKSSADPEAGSRPRRRDAEALYAYALRALGARAHSVGELREKLRQRAEKAGDVAVVLARLKEQGYLDDRQFAESFSAARLQNDGFGKNRVLRDLRQRRVAPAVAGRAVEQVYRDTDEVRLIEEFLARKYRKVALPQYLAEGKHLAAAYRRLRLAGFSAPNTLRVLRRFAREPEALDGLEGGEEPSE